MARFNSQPITGSITAGGTVTGLTQNAFTELAGTAPYTVTLPSPLLYPGYNQTFYNATSGTITLSTPANNFTGAGGSGTSTVIVPTSSTINIVSDGTNYVVVGEDGTSLTATTGAFSGNVTINGASATLSVTPQTVTINPGGTSTIDNVNIGGTSRGSGAFNTLTANNAVTLTAGTASSSTTTGTLVVTGGIGASGNIYAGGTVSANALSGPLTGTIQTASQTNITAVGTLTSVTTNGIITATYSGASNATYGVNQVVRIDSNANTGYSIGIPSSGSVVGGYYINGGTNSYDGGIEYNATTRALSLRSAGANSITLDSSGNVVIGGNLSPYNATTDVLTLKRTQNTFSQLVVDNQSSNPAAGSSLSLSSYGGGWTVQVPSSTTFVNPLVFNFGASEKLRLDSVGNITPGSDNAQTLGSSTKRWSNFYGTVDNTVNINTNTSANKPTLVADFTTGVFDHRIFFLRNSIGTYTGPDGYIKTAPINTPRIDWDPITRECKGLLIEETRTNYRTFSDRMDQGFTSPSNIQAVIPNAALAPDGTWSATKVIENLSNARHEISASQSLTNGTIYTYSVYAKAAGRNYIALAYAGNPISNFNLSNGTVVGSSANITPAIQSVGNGWYRCAITFTATSTTTTAIYHCIISTAVSGNVETYTGNGLSGLLLWGGQFETANYMSSYIPTTTVAGGRNSVATYYDSSGQLRTAAANTNRYGYAYDGISKWYPIGNIIEAASTNLLATSSISAFSTGQNLNTSSIANVLAPDGSNGVWKMTPNTSNASHSIYYPHPVTSAATRTLSGYFKGNGYNYIRIYADGGSTYNMGNVLFGLTGNGTAVLDGSALAGTQSYGIQPVGNGWYRCWVTGAMDGAQCYYHIDVYNNAPSPSYAGDGTSGVYGWGLQSELGSVMTSYIATSGATATRVADSSSSTTVTRLVDNARYTSANLTSWYNQSASTIYVEHDVIGLSNNASVAHDVFCFSNVLSGLNYGTETGGVAIGYNNTTSPGLSYSISGVGGATILASPALNTRYKTAAAWTAGTNVLYGVANGGTVVSNSWTIPTYQYILTLGNSPDVSGRVLNGHIYKLIYYPTQLTTSELQEISG